MLFFLWLRGSPGENHAKGATAHIIDLAHTLHIDITWGSIDRYGIRLVQASFICVSKGGSPWEAIFTFSQA